MNKTSVHHSAKSYGEPTVRQRASRPGPVHVGSRDGTEQTDRTPALSPSGIQCKSGAEEPEAPSREEKGNIKTNLYQKTVVI